MMVITFCNDLLNVFFRVTGTLAYNLKIRHFYIYLSREDKHYKNCICLACLLMFMCYVSAYIHVPRACFEVGGTLVGIDCLFPPYEFQR